MKVWRKFASVKWEDAWEERLASFGPGRLLLVRHPGRRFMRIEVWDVRASEARALVAQFGGSVAEVDPRRALAKGLERPRPICIRGRLKIVSSPEDLPSGPSAGKSPKHLVIPSGLAFGTGSHPTTSTCLRMVCDFAKNREPGRWEMIDIGTGTGILAMAGRLMGARAVVAFDNDPAAVRTARLSVEANGLKRIRLARLDISRWECAAPVALVTANLFHHLLIGSALRIANAVAPDGRAVISGILREQAPAVLSAMQSAGLDPEHVHRTGKWVTALLAKPAVR